MNRVKIISVAIAAALLVAGCGSDDTAAADATTDKSTNQASTKPQPPIDENIVTKPSAPYAISYNIIGTPVVGSPLTIQLQVRSAIGVSAVRFDYRTLNSAAMVLGPSQPPSVSAEYADNESSMREQITVVPQRQGRHFLNVSATLMTATGQEATSIAIPIQVGEGGRELIEQGVLETTESGETVRVLPGN